MTRPTLDYTHWPVLRIYVPADVDVDDIPALFGEWERACTERGKHVASLDMRDFNPMNAFGPIRHVAAREVSRGMPSYEGTLVGVTRVVAHPLTRAFLTAFDWLVPLPWPVLNTECPHAAEAWLRSRASAEGLGPVGELGIDAFRQSLRGPSQRLAS